MKSFTISFLLVLSSTFMMPSTLFAVPHSSALLEFSAKELSCTKDFILHDTYCYRYFGYELKRSFHPAQKMCSKYSSSLVSLHTFEEELFVVQITQNNSAFWIGLSDEDETNSIRREGVFQWTTGEQFSSQYANWKSGEPSNKQHLDCVKADYTGWSMARGGCASSRLPFVCKKRACPQGLDWNGSTCDDSISEVTTTQPLATGGDLSEGSMSAINILYLALSMVAMATCLLACYSIRTMFYSNRTKHNSHQLSLVHRHSNNRVEDIYPT